MVVNRNQKKIIALLICAVILSSLLISVVYLAKEANHKCPGDHCPVCMQMQEVRRSIDQVGSAILLTFLLGLAISVLFFGLSHFFIHIISPTPVSQNIRMNN